MLWSTGLTIVLLIECVNGVLKKLTFPSFIFRPISKTNFQLWQCPRLSGEKMNPNLKIQGFASLPSKKNFLPTPWIHGLASMTETKAMAKTTRRRNLDISEA